MREWDDVFGLHTRSVELTAEKIEEYKKIGKENLSSMIDAYVNDSLPYRQQSVAFDLIEEAVNENPELVDSEFVSKMFKYFPSGYFAKEVSLMVRKNPEVFKEEFDNFLHQGDWGGINDTKELIKITTEVLGEDFFKDEEIIEAFKNCSRNRTIKTMHDEFSRETFEVYFRNYLKNAKGDSIVHLAQALTVNNNFELAEYLPELMEACDIRDRKTLFEIALIADNTAKDQISDCLTSLRREDLTNIINEIVNKEINLDTVLGLGSTLDTLDVYQDILAERINDSVKDKLLNALELSSSEIFPDNDDKELKNLNSKHFAEDYSKLHSLLKVFRNDENEFDERDLKLLDFSIKNITQILALDDKALKHKQIQNIIEHEEVIKNQIGQKRLEENPPLYTLDNECSTVLRDTKLKEAERCISNLEEDIVSEFYESLGIDNRELSVNESLKGKNIRYGVEIEEIGVATNDFMNEDDYITYGFFTTSECSLRNYRKDFEHSVPFKSDTCGSEFVSNVLSASSIEDLLKVQAQMDVLKGERARTNFSCGMHIHVSSPSTLDDKQGIASKMNEEFKYVQEAVIDNFEVYPSRLETQCKLIHDFEPDMYDRFKTVNMASLNKHGSIEFRFFNMPDALDMKVLESYIDFATCYYAYVEEDKHFKSTCLDFVKENSDWLLNAPETLKSQAIFSMLCEDIEVKESTKKVLGRLPEIFDFYTAIEPENPERYNCKNVSISDELKGITKIEFEDEEEDTQEENFISYYESEVSSVDIMIENALYEIAEAEINNENELNDKDESEEFSLDNE